VEKMGAASEYNNIINTPTGEDMENSLFASQMFSFMTLITCCVIGIL